MESKWEINTLHERPYHMYGTYGTRVLYGAEMIIRK